MLIAIEFGLGHRPSREFANALVSDPPSAGGDQDYRSGVRGTLESNFRWSAGWFHGVNYRNDKLLFVASQQTEFSVISCGPAA